MNAFCYRKVLRQNKMSALMDHFTRIQIAHGQKTMAVQKQSALGSGLGICSSASITTSGMKHYGLAVAMDLLKA